MDESGTFVESEVNNDIYEHWVKLTPLIGASAGDVSGDIEFTSIYCSFARLDHALNQAVSSVLG